MKKYTGTRGREWGKGMIGQKKAMYSVIGKKAVKRKVCLVPEKFYQHHELREK